MIKVEDLFAKSQKQQAESAKENQDKLEGKQPDSKKKIWPWVLGILALAGIGYLLWKNGSKNEGVPT